MSDLKATVAETKEGFHVEGYEKIEYDFAFIDNIFDTSRSDLADCYTRWGRCLAVMDLNIFNVYGERMQKYFNHYNIDLDIHKTMIGEKAKSIETFLSIVDSMNKFGIYRKVCGTYSGRSSISATATPRRTPHADSRSRNLYSSLAVDWSLMLLGKNKPLPKMISRHSDPIITPRRATFWYRLTNLCLLDLLVLHTDATPTTSESVLV